VYNAWTEKLAFLPAESIEKLRAKSLRHLSIADVLSLAACGALVGEDANEQGNLLSRIRTRRMGQPLRLVLIPTYACNLRCSYCYAQDSVGPGEAPELTEWVSDVCEFVGTTIPALKRKRVTIALFGGEPLLAAEPCAELVERCAAMCRNEGTPLYTTLTTSGSILNAGVHRLLKSIQSMQVTLDGSREIHNRYRFYPGGGGTYDTIVAVSRAAAAWGTRIAVRFHLHEVGEKELRTAARELRQELAGVDRLNVYFADVAPGCYLDSIRCEDNSEYREAVPRRIDARNAFLAEGWEARQLSYTLPTDGALPLDHRCNFLGDGTWLLDCDRRAYLCPVALRNPSMEVARLTKEGMIPSPLLEELLQMTQLPRECASCRVAPLCEGGCPMRAIVKNSDWKKPVCQRRRILGGLDALAKWKEDNETVSI
jgi:uncharacterized protein